MKRLLIFPSVALLLLLATLLSVGSKGQICRQRHRSSQD